MEYLFYNGNESDLLNKGFKYNGYAYELNTLGEYSTAKLTIHFEKEKGIILFNYCAPYDVNPNDILNFIKETKDEDINFFFRKTKFGTIPSFRWHHKFGVISDQDWASKLKGAESYDAWYEEIEDLEGFKLNNEICQLREIVDFLEVRDI